MKPVAIPCLIEKPRPAFQDVKVRALTNRVLLTYLEERCVDVETAKNVCKEVYFKQNGKSYFAVAFPNISGGYEIRNRYFKA